MRRVGMSLAKMKMLLRELYKHLCKRLADGGQG